MSEGILVGSSAGLEGVHIRYYISVPVNLNRASKAVNSGKRGGSQGYSDVPIQDPSRLLSI